VDLVGFALFNLYQIFYPERILIYDPFTENEVVFRRLVKEFKASVPEYARNAVTDQRITGKMSGALFGRTYPFFRSALKRYLTARWDT